MKFSIFATLLLPSFCRADPCCTTDYASCSPTQFCNESEADCGKCRGFWISLGDTTCGALGTNCATSDECCGEMICQILTASQGGPFDGCAWQTSDSVIAPTPAPTTAPTTSAPTPPPTTEITPVPSPDPTLSPTTSPTPAPTPSPTLSPTPAPSPEPTPVPTPSLTSAPVAPVAPPVSSGWALEETFDGDPAAPSQDLLPSNFDFVVTHRTHAGQHFSKSFDPFLADHDANCAGPNPNVTPLPQHSVTTRQDTSAADPDESFYICKNHMMSAMGDVEGYSVSSFWPRQEFNFAGGGTLEFEVNINTGHGARSWWEIMITPRDQLKVGAAIDWLPISETYPKDRIILEFKNLQRQVRIGTGALSPAGWILQESQWWQWPNIYPNDPALTDHRIRRRMQITLGGNVLTWGIEKEDGSFDDYVVNVPGGGLPFDQGLVLFKTHAYNPEKDDNYDTYTFHWDNIRFDGPVVGKYETWEASDVVYLQANGNRPIGDSETVTITIPVGAAIVNPVLFGQVDSPLQGQVLLSINGGAQIEVSPYDYENESNCHSMGWKSFRLELDPITLLEGTNTFQWTVGPRPGCVASWVWNGFSIKFLQIQVDGDGSSSFWAR